MFDLLLRKTNRSSTFVNLGKQTKKERTNRELACVCFRAFNLQGSHGFQPLVPVLCCQWFGAWCMRVFPRLARFACFVAFGTGLILSAVGAECMRVFPCLARFACFAALGTGLIMSAV